MQIKISGQALLSPPTRHESHQYKTNSHHRVDFGFGDGIDGIDTPNQVIIIGSGAIWAGPEEQIISRGGRRRQQAEDRALYRGAEPCRGMGEGRESGESAQVGVG